jgi:competence protein ComEC
MRVAADVVRTRFSGAARHALPKTQAGLLLGMTDGDTALLDDATAEDFRTTGLAHIVAVSGYNVAVFLALVLLFVRALVPRGRWLRVAIAMPSLLFFVFLTGLEPSVLRATLSAGVALVVTAGGRTTDALRAAALAFLVLLLAAPQLLFDIGFQLSFGATIGIVVWGEPLSKRFARVVRRESRLLNAVTSGLGTTMAAQLAVAPLLAWHFGRIPGFGALANVVAIPLGGVVMLGGLATLGAASLVPFLDWAPATMRLPLDMILWSAHAFAQVPAASITITAVAACALTGALVAFVMESPRVRAGVLAFVVVCAGAAVGQARAASGCGGPAIVALDVGQGSAVLLRSGGHAIVVDTGPEKGNVVGQLRAAGVDKLDAILITHSHIDHALGALDVLEKMNVGHLLGPLALHWASGADVIRAARGKGLRFEPLATGDSYDAGDIHVDVLSPDDGELPPFDEELIDAKSLVVRATVDGVPVILPGDIRSPVQKALIRADVRAPILIAPHHGSKDLDAGFVEAVDPRLTLITVGAPNPYGLPAPEAVRAYASRGRVFRTDQDGRVTVCLNEQGAEVVVER